MGKKGPPKGVSNNPSGKGKGHQNRQTIAVKQCLINAFEEIGGWRNLASWAKANQTEFYKIWSRMLPHEVTGPDGEDIVIRIKKEIVSRARDTD